MEQISTLMQFYHHALKENQMLSPSNRFSQCPTADRIVQSLGDFRVGSQKQNIAKIKDKKLAECMQVNMLPRHSLNSSIESWGVVNKE